MIIENLQKFYSYLILEKPILGIDYGKMKIGIAISDANHQIAMPLSVVNNNNINTTVNIIINYLAKYNICAIVIGLPINMYSGYSNQTTLIYNFGKTLASKIQLPIYFQDERISSKVANNILGMLGLQKKKNIYYADAIAASLILDTTLSCIKKI